MDVLKNILKGFGKFLLSIVTFVLMIVLTVDIVVYSVRDMSSHYFKESTIKEMIGTIDVTDLLMDSNGNELAPITEIKNELVAAGIPVEVAEELLNSEPVKEVTANVIQVGVDYVIYDKEIETPKISSDDVYKFFEENLPIVVKELQENNIPNSELLTEDKQQLILQQIKEKAPIIETKVNEVLEPVLEELKTTDEYQELENYKKEADEALDMIQFVYGTTVTTILLIIGVICMVLIMLSRRSFYKGFKWIGISFIFAGLIIYSITLFMPFIKESIGEVPYVFRNFVSYIFDDIINICRRDGIVCFVISVILIVINIIGYSIYEKKENKEFEI